MKKLTSIFWWYSKENEQSWSIHRTLLDVFYSIQLSFPIFYGVNCQIHMITDMIKNIWMGIFHKGMLLIWKEYFMHAILSFSSPRCAIIARLNVIYTEFRRAMIAQLNKIWHVWACARAITHGQACYLSNSNHPLMCGLWVLDKRMQEFIERGDRKKEGWSK